MALKVCLSREGTIKNQTALNCPYCQLLQMSLFLKVNFVLLLRERVKLYFSNLHPRFVSPMLILV